VLFTSAYQTEVRPGKADPITRNNRHWSNRSPAGCGYGIAGDAVIDFAAGFKLTVTALFWPLCRHIQPVRPEQAVAFCSGSSGVTQARPEVQLRFSRQLGTQFLSPILPPPLESSELKCHDFCGSALIYQPLH